MEMTIHGMRRVLGRTLMDPTAVLALLEEGRAITLGRHEGATFFLFYSPPDKKAKIALVGEPLEAFHTDKQLITIWEADFALPRGIKTPNQALLDEAYEIWAQREIIQAEVEVLYAGKPVFNWYLPLSLRFAQAEFAVISELKGNLGPLSALVEKILKEHGLHDATEYRIWCLEPYTREVLYRHDIPHRRLLSYMKHS